MLTVFELVNPLTPAVSADAPLEKAIILFDQTRWPAVPVVRDGIFCGVIERKKLKTIPALPGARVRDLLNKDTIFLSPGDSAEVAADLLASGHIAVIPIVNDGGCLAGVITQTDIPPSMWQAATRLAKIGN